ncbi:MAG TPA: YceI family protein, partial [Flavipsychrobacter sp.]|nr:YceI family protein [Flavipsychrobacter sp.]
MKVLTNAIKFRTLVLNIVIIATAIIPANAQQYVPTDQNSTVQFKIENHLMGSTTVTGYFKGLKGIIVFDPNSLANASFDVSVNVRTISTGIGMRDNDLKKEKFFDADKYPTMHFKSTKVTKGSQANTYMLYGNLTIKNVTKPVTIPFKATPSNGGCIFTGTFQVNRMAYNVSADKGKIEDNANVMLKVFA